MQIINLPSNFDACVTDRFSMSIYNRYIAGDVFVILSMPPVPGGYCGDYTDPSGITGVGCVILAGQKLREQATTYPLLSGVGYGMMYLTTGLTALVYSTYNAEYNCYLVNVTNGVQLCDLADNYWGIPMPSNTPTPSASKSVGATASVTPSRSYSSTSTASVSMTATNSPRNLYPITNPVIDPQCGTFDYADVAVYDLPILSVPPDTLTPGTEGWYSNAVDYTVTARVSGDQGCYGVSIIYGSSDTILHIVCVREGVASATFDPLYDVATNDSYTFDQGEGWDTGISIYNGLMGGVDTRRGSCQDSGTVICKRECHWWSDCHTGTIGMEANVYSRVQNLGRMFKATPQLNVNYHCVYIMYPTNTNTLASRAIGSDGSGIAVTNSIAVPLNSYTGREYVQDPIRDALSGFYAGDIGCRDDQCRHTFPLARGYSTLTDRNWLWDQDGAFANNATNPIYGGAWSDTVTLEPGVNQDSCSQDPVDSSTTTIMMSIGALMLNRAVHPIFFEAGVNLATYSGPSDMVVYSVGQSFIDWPKTTVNGFCSNWNQNLYDVLNYTRYVAFARFIYDTGCPGPAHANLCAPGYENKRVNYAFDANQLCLTYFKALPTTLVSDYSSYDELINMCQNIYEAYSTCRRGMEPAGETIVRNIALFDAMNAIGFAYASLTNSRVCPAHYIGTWLTPTPDMLTGVINFGTGAFNDAGRDLKKLCGPLYAPDANGINTESLACHASSLLVPSSQAHWAHTTARDNANPPHRFNTGLGLSTPVTDYVCPATITDEGCVAPDDDGCKFGRSSAGFWEEIDWYTSAGTQIFDLIPQIEFGTTVSYSDLGPTGVVFNALSQPMDIHIGRRYDNDSKVTNIKSYHSPMVCPVKFTGFGTDGKIGTGAGSYVNVRVEFNWIGLPYDLYYFGFTQTTNTNNPGAITLESQHTVRSGTTNKTFQIPFSISSPANYGTAELTMSTYYLDSNDNRLQCTYNPSISVSYSVDVLDPKIIVEKVGHIFGVDECILGICATGWPFGLGFGSVIAILLAILILIATLCALPWLGPIVYTCCSMCSRCKCVCTVPSKLPRIAMDKVV